MCRVYVLSNQACDGQCGEQLQVNMRGSCEPGWNTRLCSGSPIMVNSLCNGQCYGDLVTIRVSYFESGRLGYVMVFLLFIQICTNEFLTWTCEGESILLETPFKGSCPVGRFLFNNLCEHEVRKCDEMLHLYIYIYPKLYCTQFSGSLN